jgi:hypothetical protein
VRLIDGTINYSEAKRKVSVEKVDEEVCVQIAKNSFYSLAKFEQLSPKHKTMLENYIGLIVKDGVEVEVFLPPYHPKYYMAIVERKDLKMVIEAEKYIRNLCKNRKIVCLGSYDPNKIGFSGSDFYDYMHPKRESLNKYLSRAYKK